MSTYTNANEELEPYWTNIMERLHADHAMGPSGCENGAGFPSR